MPNLHCSITVCFKYLFNAYNSPNAKLLENKKNLNAKIDFLIVEETFKQFWMWYIMSVA